MNSEGNQGRLGGGSDIWTGLKGEIEGGVPCAEDRVYQGYTVWGKTGHFFKHVPCGFCYRKTNVVLAEPIPEMRRTLPILTVRQSPELTPGCILTLELRTGSSPPITGLRTLSPARGASFPPWDLCSGH